MQQWAWGMGPPHGFGVGHQEHRCNSPLTIETAIKFTWKPMFCFRCLKLKSPYNICSRGRPLWGLCQKCSQGIYKNQWAPNWNLQMEQQNFPSWLDWKIMEVGIMMKWENKFQRWSLASAIVRVPWETSEQALVTEVKFIVLLWVGRCCPCGYCSYCRRTQCQMCSPWESLSTLQQAKARPSLGSSCALLPPVFWITALWT